MEVHVMPFNTPTNESLIDRFEDDVSVGIDSSPPPSILRGHSATDDISGVLVYTHGCSVRVEINLEAANAIDALTRCGWNEVASPSIWKSSNPAPGTTRFVMRGSKWLDERAPGNAKLALVGRNREWKTRIYSLAVERKNDAFHVDLQVVRYADIRKFMEEVLGLAANDYEIAYFRTVERFIVLPPHEAFRLAEGLSATPSSGRGRLARKRYLAKDIEVPIIVRKRAKATANLVVYRIDRGATAAYKVEVRLRGQRRDRGQFHETDIEKLDGVLLDLVQRHDLHPIPKPARWEPRSFTTTLERGAFDPSMKRLPQRAWRGTQISRQLKQTVENCHTPSLVRWVACPRDSDAFPPSTRIRSDITPSVGSVDAVDAPDSTIKNVNTNFTNIWKCVAGKSFEVTRYILENHGDADVHHAAARDPWKRIADDIAHSRLYLHEVLLDPEQSPGPLLHALVGGALGKIGVAALCAVDFSGDPDTWRSVCDATMTHPFEEADVDTFVIVIDPSAVDDVASAVIGNDTFQWGPLMPPASVATGMDPLQTLFKATGAWLAGLFQELRRHGEETGVRYVIVTCDARPAHGRGALQRSHFFRDPRVRSSIGDAGRHYAHMRYLVERVIKTTWKNGYHETIEDGDATILVEHHPRVEQEPIVGNVVVIKDEAEGLTGRLVYEAPSAILDAAGSAGGPRRRPQRRKSDTHTASVPQNP
jgi:hypothetical protein